VVSGSGINILVDFETFRNVSPDENLRESCLCNRFVVISPVQTHSVWYLEIRDYRFIPHVFYHAVILPSHRRHFVSATEIAS
jgi:hypothetical protein